MWTLFAKLLSTVTRWDLCPGALKPLCIFICSWPLCTLPCSTGWNKGERGSFGAVTFACLFFSTAPLCGSPSGLSRAPPSSHTSHQLFIDHLLSSRNWTRYWGHHGKTDPASLSVYSWWKVHTGGSIDGYLWLGRLLYQHGVLDGSELS